MLHSAATLYTVLQSISCVTGDKGKNRVTRNLRNCGKKIILHLELNLYVLRIFFNWTTGYSTKKITLKNKVVLTRIERKKYKDEVFYSYIPWQLTNTDLNWLQLILGAATRGTQDTGKLQTLGSWVSSLGVVRKKGISNVKTHSYTGENRKVGPCGWSTEGRKSEKGGRRKDWKVS